MSSARRILPVMVMRGGQPPSHNRQYSPGAAHVSANIAGYAMAVVHPARLIDTAMKKLPSSYQRAIAVQAVDAATGGEVIYSSEAWPEKGASPESQYVVK